MLSNLCGPARALAVVALCLASAAAAGPVLAQEFQPHRAAYSVAMIEHGKPTAGAPGTYAF